MPNNDEKKLKILISAYACEPYKGSEPGVGWNWVKQVARFHEVWVVTRANNRSIIETALKASPMPDVHWVYFDLPKYVTFWKRGTAGVRLYYYLWQIGLYFIAKNLSRQTEFDVFHHVTFGKYWVPCFAGLLPWKFIFGPVGGGETTPKGFFKAYSLRGKVFELVRTLARTMAMYDPFLRRSIKKADLILATTYETADKLKKLCPKEMQVQSQVAMSHQELEFLKNSASTTSDKFIILSIGRLVHWKGFHLAISAFARFTKSFPNSEYWIINSGFEYHNLKGLILRSDIEDRVRLLGTLPQLSDVYERLNQCHVLVHPALHEAFGNVCLEAMAAAKPVICLNVGGPALQVTEETGFKIATHSPEQAIEDMASAMLKLALNPELRKKMGKAGQNRAFEYFNWEKKEEFIKQIYQKVLT